MFALSSTAVEHELAYRRHELEKAAARAELIHRADLGEATTHAAGRSTWASWWRRVRIAH